jgi:hypothetical protein
MVRTARHALFIVAVGAGACADAPAPAPAPEADSTRGALTEAAPDLSLLSIRPDGIGHAAAGFTVADLRRALPPEARVGDIDQQFMVDMTAVPIILADDTLYHLLFGSRETVADTVSLEMVATLNPAAKTYDGIGPGTTLAAAAALRGAPTLSFHTTDESREYAVFPEQPSTVFFRVRASGDGGYAGVYTTRGEYNTTKEYDPNATISMIVVNLRRE